MNKIKALAKKITRPDGHVFMARSVTKKFVEGPLADSMEDDKWYDVHIVKDAPIQPEINDKKYIDLFVTDKNSYTFLSSSGFFPCPVVLMPCQIPDAAEDIGGEMCGKRLEIRCI